ncbi:hypothetical protein BHK98_08475 [Hornefia porci]|uniref:Transcriptional regulator, AbiEi antitoxin, Type IV TA system n=1 Tax=Hornefia porci TaxID=2652292 RepID=A0A1Q9JIW1_9FIRM|nr:hypothetical protein [Hornefia porci]OLR56095.1 hypothetical protein BHK98_08475 [Hornefia porci]
MLLSYQECIDRYGNDYKLKKELANGTLFMKEKGIYSTKRSVSEIDIIMRKYPKAICTGNSAFYYHSLTDVIPGHYYLATRRTDTRIKDPRVRQSFMKEDIFKAGITELQYNNSIIRIYSPERMLIELMRFRARIPMDYYKEIIQNYRKLSFEMDFGLVEDYAGMFRNGAKLMDMIQMEVL